MISNFRKGYDMLGEICPIYGYLWLFHKKNKENKICSPLSIHSII